MNFKCQNVQNLEKSKVRNGGERSAFQNQWSNKTLNLCRWLKLNTILKKKKKVQIQKLIKIRLTQFGRLWWILHCLQGWIHWIWALGKMMKRNKTWMREKLGTWNITLENHRERGFFLFFIHIFHVFSFFHLQVWIIVNKMDLSIQYFRLYLVSRKFERKYKKKK